MLCNRISGSWQCTETVAPVGNPRGEMPSIGHPRRRVSKPHCRCAGRPNGWTWGSEERQAVAGGTRSCLDSCVKPSRRSPLGESRENHMVTQRFWSSAIYLATSNSHASGIVGPRHDHMAIIHRQAIDKQASTHKIVSPKPSSDETNAVPECYVGVRLVGSSRRNGLRR